MTRTQGQAGHLLVHKAVPSSAQPANISHSTGTRQTSDCCAESFPFKLPWLLPCCSSLLYNLGFRMALHV